MKNVLAALSFSAVLAIAVSVSAQETAQVTVSPPSASTPSATVAIDPAKEADIRKLLELTGAKAMFTQSVTTMTSLMQKSIVQANPDNPKVQELSNLLAAKLRDNISVQYGELLKLLIPLYDKYYTKDDLDQIIQFDQTPLGQKLLKVTPEISRESQTIGYQWGARIGRDAVAQVLQEHPELRGLGAQAH
jgi:hypothetical protein